MAELRILYFAWLRERVGRSEETLELPAEVRTVAALRRHLIARGDGYPALAEPTVRVAVNQAMADAATALAPGDEVAFFPPVTGG
ncbi:MAG: molybdopterin converting factor subunit 1 [Rhodospirillales bacterium]|nr:molybdopterin converting factor subunit 1 [Rhodospirillales bacterium]